MNSVANNYNRKKIVFSHGKGLYLFTNNGEKYIDLAAGIAVNLLGHSNKDLINALNVQSKKLWHVSNLYEIEEQVALAKKLTNCSFANKVFFCNSGAEAVECTIKAARRYHFSKGKPEKTEIITFKGSFHGRTLGTIAAANNTSHQEGFGEPLKGFVSIERNDIDQLKKICNEKTAAILIEPVQGEGGINVFNKEFIDSLQVIAEKNDLLILFDEVQCGVARTGKIFAYKWFDIKPDVMALAKGLGGGFPIGACLMRDDVAEALIPGTHGSTFGGNPLAMAVGSCVMDIVNTPDFLSSIEKKGLFFKDELNTLQKKYPNVIAEIRGLGLMIGIKCAVENNLLANKLYENGVLTVNAADNVIRILPPLNITMTEIKRVISLFEKSIKEIL
ncbi:MAG: acetylornithine transaminase [Rhizobiales bacterium TMED28]|nr:acetylornithine transaminase [Rhodobiaceae bacterium]OUT82088.1 MAG: acetylornithine transaminase [Rhizobiales bacterium TMED28]|tara:strand:+ start:5731 stop:6897 length:1167 start_codon:yes stop_codon:yes gene_type:complete